jgi:catechol 2,3-dioxygenase-like lactoylglutathione lyase family enzyme
MSIIGIESLIYGVTEIDTSRRFFRDFGLTLEAGEANSAKFRLPDNATVLLFEKGHAALPPSSLVGDGVAEVIWGVDDAAALETIAVGLARDRELIRDDDGTVHFLTDFGVAMGLRVFEKKAVVTAPAPLNAPGHVGRLNQHRRWRLRAFPKTIAHVVFAVPNYIEAHAFMRDRLAFRLSDIQRGFGMYLRADGSNNHHNLLLLNASVPMPGMDGKARFHHANFAVEDIDELMVGANYMVRQGWEPSHFGLGRHRIDSALFYYMPCPAGGEAEYGADSDYIDDSWVSREFIEPLFAYAHFVHNIPPFLMKPPAWQFEYMTGPDVASDTKL